MTFNINFDQHLATEADLSLKATFVFDILYKAKKWAKVTKVNDKEYRLMYRQKIIDELPRCKISLRTLSNLLTELKIKGLIKVVNENTSPAYRITEYAELLLDKQKRRKQEITKNESEE